MTADHRNNYGKRTRPYNDYEEDSGSKRRNRGEERDPFIIHPDDTVYRYLCPVKKIGSIIGRGGEIVKQLRIDTKSKIRIGESVPGCEERVVTVYSCSDETNASEENDFEICPAQDALFRVHDRVVSEDLHAEDGSDGSQLVTARFLVPSDQIGCVIGKGGQIVQNIRSETGAQIRILKDQNLPSCALRSDELLQISGEPDVVKKALYQIACRLHENPSRSQHLLTSAISGAYPSGSLIAPAGGAPIVSIASFMGSYGGYKAEAGEWSRALYPASRNEASMKEFSLILVCPTVNIGGVIGKGGAIINQLRQETKATIKVDSSTEGDNCLITISAKELFEDTYSPTIQAAVRLQPKCSEKIERDSGIISFTTRMLVPSSRIGCLIGKGGAIITEMRRVTKANIRILAKENVPKAASRDDEMVQISGELDVAKDALVQIASRLRANVFDREGAVSAFLPVLPYLPMTPESADDLSYDSRESRRSGRGHAYPGSYSSSDLAVADGFGVYGGSQVGSNGNSYGLYGGYGRNAASGLSNHSSRRKSYGY